MLKNYIKEDQKLPLFGVGPYLVLTMAIVNIIGVILFGYVLNVGTLEGVWVIVFRFIGIVLLVIGIYIWYIGAVKSDMDDSITENHLQTKGIYSIVRNPMYTAIIAGSIVTLAVMITVVVIIIKRKKNKSGEVSEN